MSGRHVSMELCVLLVCLGVCVDANLAKVTASIHDDQLALFIYLCVGEIDYKETEIDMGGLRSPDLALSMFCVFLQKVRLGLLTSCLDSSVGVRWIRLM